MPPAKKRRVLTEAAVVSKGALIPNDVTHHPPPKERAIDVLYEQHKSTLQSLLADIASLTSLATSPSSPSSASQPNQQNLLTSTLRSLATLKFLTRQICLQTTQNHTESSWEKRKQVEQVSLMLENLNYEKGYLRGEIELCRGWNGGELAKLASEEMGVEYQKGGHPGDSMNDGSRDPCDVNVHGSGDIDEIIDAYLFESNKNADTTETSATSSPVDTTQKTSHRNPQNHAIILQKLQKDLTTRSNLVQQLSESKLKLSQLQKRKEELNGHLKQIPRKLRQLEKAGEELSRFFGKGAAVAGLGEEDPISIDDKGDEDVTMEEKEDQEWKKIQEANLLVHQPSTATRMERFQLAQSKLPSPLYVLYVQLVGYLDAWSSLELLRQEPGSRSGKRDAYEKHDPLGGFVGAAGMDVVAVPPTINEDEDRETKDWNVVLSLTQSEIIPSELSTFSPAKLGRKAKIEIVFSFDAGRGVVLASVEDKCEILHQGLLDELFPGDDGLVSPNASLGMLKKDEGDDDGQTCEGRDAELENQQGEEMEKVAQSQGKPYYWCQILAGLSFPAPNSSLNTYETSTIEADNDAEKATFQIQVCTKAVLRQILRRIRARRTLKILLEALGKKSQMHPLPIHPSMKGSVTAGVNNSNGNVFSTSSQPVVKAKLVSWVEDCKYAKDPSTTPLTTRYIATIKRKSSTLKAIVLIETENYPCVPPVWTLQYEDGTRGSYSSWGENHGSISSLQSPDMNSNTSNTSAPPLFDAALHRIECHVNNDLEKFLRPDVETTFDWILIHQLADIISCWDEAMSVGEKSGSGSNGGNSSRAKNGEDGGVGGYPRRWRKGKDRQLVGFGDKSPFFLYRNGL